MLAPHNYSAIRAVDVISRVRPFESASTIVWPSQEQDAAERAEAETWLQSWIGAEQPVGELVPAITGDLRWPRGRALAALDMMKEALAELNSLRYDLRADALASYQLALAFRDMGLYRSSILAASVVLRLSPAQTVLDAPRFLARLVYPAYYRDLVAQAAAKEKVDPLYRHEAADENDVPSRGIVAGTAAGGSSSASPGPT